MPSLAARAGSRLSRASACRAGSRRTACAGGSCAGRRWRRQIASVLAALLVRRILVHGPVFPRQYLYLFFVAFLALLGVVLLTAALTERASRVPVVPRPLFAGLRAAPDLLRLPAYRRYLIFRVVALVATLAEPFYIVYALRSFNVSDGYDRHLRDRRDRARGR